MGYYFSSRLTATLNLCLIYFKITWALVILLEHKHKKFEINQTKIKGSCQSGRKVVTYDSKSDLALIPKNIHLENYQMKVMKTVIGIFCKKEICHKKRWKSNATLERILPQCDSNSFGDWFCKVGLLWCGVGEPKRELTTTTLDIEVESLLKS